MERKPSGRYIGASYLAFILSLRDSSSVDLAFSNVFNFSISCKNSSDLFLDASNWSCNSHLSELIFLRLVSAFSNWSSNSLLCVVLEDESTGTSDNVSWAEGWRVTIKYKLVDKGEHIYRPAKQSLSSRRSESNCEPSAKLSSTWYSRSATCRFPPLNNCPRRLGNFQDPYIATRRRNRCRVLNLKSKETYIEKMLGQDAPTCPSITTCIRNSRYRVLFFQLRREPPADSRAP